jgi:hypothetical protein
MCHNCDWHDGHEFDDVAIDRNGGGNLRRDGRSIGNDPSYNHDRLHPGIESPRRDLDGSGRNQHPQQHHHTRQYRTRLALAV